jgi:hypothetical protein
MMIKRIADDSGLMAIIDPDAYPSFVRRNWDYDELVEHFILAMKHRQLLIWGTGSENLWNVEIGVGIYRDGYRVAEGGIHSSEGRLHVVSYESLTMAAAYEYVKLPEKPFRDDVIQGATMIRLRVYAGEFESGSRCVGGHEASCSGDRPCGSVSRTV